MFRPVTLPLWLLVLILGFAVVTFASHFLFPSVRWFFRRRAEAVVARLNARLRRPIEPFKLARRFDTIQRLIYDPGVMEAVAERAEKTGAPRQVVHEEARGYAREIVPAFSASAYFGFGARAARWLSTTLYRVRIGHIDADALAAIPDDATVVFVMNHRSNMDYVLATYLAAERSATLSYAVGEWARVWPLSVLVRSMGAYFIRRSARNALYRRVLARYVQIAVAEGVTQAIFPEGRLSLDGRVGAPRLGILSYALDADPGRALWFVPVAINYDRVIEDRFLLAALRAGNRRFPVPVLRTAGYVLRRLWQKLRGRFLRYGYAVVSVGAPISRERLPVAEPAVLPAALAQALMERIRALMPVPPVPLLARVLLTLDRPDRPALEAAFAAEAEVARRSGAHVHVPHGAAGHAVRLALDHLLLRRIVTETGGRIEIREADRGLLAYYAASIEHHFPPSRTALEAVGPECGEGRGPERGEAPPQG